MVFQHTGGVEMLQDAVVHRVQVFDVKGRERQRAVELFREEVFPGIIAHKHDPFTCK